MLYQCKNIWFCEILLEIFSLVFAIHFPNEAVGNFEIVKTIYACRYNHPTPHGFITIKLKDAD